MRKSILILLCAIAAITSSAQNPPAMFRGVRLSPITNGADSASFGLTGWLWHGPNGLRLNENGTKYSLRKYVSTFASSSGLFWRTDANTTLSTNVSISGGKVTFTPTSTRAGFNVGGIAGVVSSVVNGDIWYDNTGNRFFVGASNTTQEMILGAVDPGEVVYGQSVGRVITDNEFTYNGTTNILSVPSVSLNSLTSTGGTITANVRFVTTSTATSEGITLGSFSGIPSAANNGGLWYNSLSNTIGARINNTNRVLAHFTSGTIGSGRVPYVGASANGDLETNSGLFYTTSNNTLTTGRLQAGTTSAVAAVGLGSGSSTDPTTTNNGDLWTNSSTQEIKAKINNVNRTVVLTTTPSSNRIPFFQAGSPVSGILDHDSDFSFNNGLNRLSVPNIVLSGYLMADGTEGTPGQFLTSNGTDPAFWSDPPAFFGSATNGLNSPDGSTVKLGGSLSEATTIDGSFDLTLDMPTLSIGTTGVKQLIFGHGFDSNATFDGYTTFDSDPNGFSQKTAPIEITPDDAPNFGITDGNIWYETGVGFQFRQEGATVGLGGGGGGGDMILASAQTSTGKKTFQSDATNAGLRLGPFASAPSSGATGDLSYKSSNNSYHGFVGADVIFPYTTEGTHQADAVMIFSGSGTTTQGLFGAHANFKYNGSSGMSVDKVTVTASIGTDGGGLKHQRFATGTISAGATTNVTCTWTTPFADGNYTVTHSVHDGDGDLQIIGMTTVSSTQVVVVVKNNDGANSSSGTVHLIAMRN